MQTSFNFAHYKLDCYRASRDLADLVMVAAERIPDGHHKMKDPILRAATGVEALIAEGANRYGSKQKRQRFVEARGEAGEVAAHLERLHRYRFITDDQLLAGLTLADRICAMLTGLIKRHA